MVDTLKIETPSDFTENNGVSSELVDEELLLAMDRYWINLRAVVDKKD